MGIKMNELGSNYGDAVRSAVFIGVASEPEPLFQRRNKARQEKAEIGGIGSLVRRREILKQKTLVSLPHRRASLDPAVVILERTLQFDSRLAM